MNQIKEYSSTEQYKDAIRHYQNRKNQELVDGGYKEAEIKGSSEPLNPITTIIDSLSNPKEEAMRRKWERVAAYSALGNMVTGIGKGIAASAGVAPTPTDTSGYDYAMKKVEQSEEREREDYLRRYKDRLAQALHIQEREERVADQTLAANSNIYQNSQKAEAQEKDALNNQYGKINYITARPSSGSSPIATSLSTNVEQPKLKEDKIDRYVYNRKGEKIALTKEDVVRLYQIAKSARITAPYDNAKSETARKNEYDVLIQQSYLMNEVERDSSNNK